MKTPEEIAEEASKAAAKKVFQHYAPSDFKNATPNGMSGIIYSEVESAINEAIQQERGRTCEWVRLENGDSFSGCRFQRGCSPPGTWVEWEGSNDRYCGGCRGIIVVKTPSTEAKEMGREGWSGCDIKSTSSRVCERGTRGCTVHH